MCAQMNRFWDKVNISDDSMCWNWTAATNNDGYGRFKINGKLESSHRIAYELTYGKIPPSKFPKRQPLCVLHSCDNSGCCNPNHLRIGTKSLNNSDMVSRNRWGNGHSTIESRRMAQLTSKESASFFR